MRQCVHALGFLHLSCVRSHLVGGFSLKRSEGGEEVLVQQEVLGSSPCFRGLISHGGIGLG